MFVASARYPVVAHFLGTKESRPQPSRSGASGHDRNHETVQVKKLQVCAPKPGQYTSTGNLSSCFFFWEGGGLLAYAVTVSGAGRIIF